MSPDGSLLIKTPSHQPSFHHASTGCPILQSPGETLKVAKGRTVVRPAARIPDLSGPANRQAETHSCSGGVKSERD